ncbi:RNA polymerase sigma factor SigJ [Frigidibacter sp. RF13]|uniref:RNA polymerase sigma factor SigJ n=1 Tax=Frigidibacter sp. RF13 TaxID=2997340 RepID=UPI00226F2FCF|nr:RNA polymerase sigma factor SigJ [Frigidibacter sp. RF13]MCY1126750.1 RNA polymerase sigma factor SigJ [Frigidibacter sp. RF13]
MADRARIETLFVRERPRLLRLAYRYLGSVSDAEDVVQEAFLKLGKAGPVDRPEGWLARTVTNGALDRLRRQKARRESYVGQWLPEPVVEPDLYAAADRELDISFAVMRTLEALSPLERAAFFLHDLFDQDFETIARTLNRTPATCRKLASRARAAVREGRAKRPATASDIAAFLQAISDAAISGDVASLAARLAADAELVSDGGGKALAALNVVRGAVPVARFLAGIARKAAGGIAVRPLTVNGAPAVMILAEGDSGSLMSFDVDGVGAVRTVYIQRNPDKLGLLTP